MNHVQLTLDAAQRAVLDLPLTASAAVIGAPGTGKTTTLIEFVADRVLNHGIPVDEVLVLTQGRVEATRLRDALALRLALPTTGPLARTVNSFAFSVVRQASMDAQATPPRLLTGGEQDADIAALLKGHDEDGGGPAWPDELDSTVRSLRRFRTELRELMMRATEYGVSTHQLRSLAGTRAAWSAAADFIEEYQAVLASSREHQLDAAELVSYAVTAIGSERPPAASRLSLVVVDDLQEATRSTLNLLSALAAQGARIVAFGDPDVAANAFRGGEPEALGRLFAITGRETSTLVLSTAYRQGVELRALTTAVTARIGAAAAGTQRAAVAAGESSEIPVSRIEATSAARQWATAARVFREEHLRHGVPWSQMAVIVRGRAQVEAIQRAFALAEVPTRTTVGGRTLREDRAARALLMLVDVGIGRRELDAELATELLLGPFGGLDRLGLRRLRLALRAEEVAGGNNRPADALLVEALADPARLATIDHRVGRQTAKLATTLQELRSSDGSIEDLLWLAWERSGLAKVWFEQATGGGITAAEANRDLDGIVALFTSAKRFAERKADSTPEVYLAEVLDAEVPEDTLSPQSGTDTVLVTTPPGVVGLEFDTVVVGGLQEGAWPDLRLRNSLFAPQELVAAVTGIGSATVDERAEVLSDELRMFALAVSRARRRVVLAAVSNDDEAASPFFGFAPDAPVLDSISPVPMTLRGATGALRRRLLNERERAEVRDAAAASLAVLAREGVPGADPADWHGLIEPSTTGPLFEGERVPVSPSNIEKVSDGALDWFLESIAGGDSGVVANVGTILHWAMETAEDPSVEGLWSAVQTRWDELLFDAPWLAERQARLARTLTVGIAEYLADFTRDRKTLVGAEKRFVLEVDNADVRGSIDRVERGPDGGVVIVDLKTGRPITAKAEIEAHPQLAAYQLAYASGALDDALAAHGEHSPQGAKLLFVKEGIKGKAYREGVQAALTEEQLDAFRDRVRQAATVIAAAEFEGVVEVEMFGRPVVGGLALHRVGAVSGD